MYAPFFEILLNLQESTGLGRLDDSLRKFCHLAGSRNLAPHLGFNETLYWFLFTDPIHVSFQAQPIVLSQIISLEAGQRWLDE